MRDGASFFRYETASPLAGAIQHAALFGISQSDLSRLARVAWHPSGDMLEDSLTMLIGWNVLAVDPVSKTHRYWHSAGCRPAVLNPLDADH
jgi:hypothetical protein